MQTFNDIDIQRIFSFSFFIFYILFYRVTLQNIQKLFLKTHFLLVKKYSGEGIRTFDLFWSMIYTNYCLEMLTLPKFLKNLFFFFCNSVKFISNVVVVVFFLISSSKFTEQSIQPSTFKIIIGVLFNEVFSDWKDHSNM